MSNIEESGFLLAWGRTLVPGDVRPLTLSRTSARINDAFAAQASCPILNSRKEANAQRELGGDDRMSKQGPEKHFSGPCYV